MNRITRTLMNKKFLRKQNNMPKLKLNVLKIERALLAHNLTNLLVCKAHLLLLYLKKMALSKIGSIKLSKLFKRLRTKRLCLVYKHIMKDILCTGDNVSMNNRRNLFCLFEYLHYPRVTFEK
ncbi:hypothetical protein BpHYR1_024541 [Brachionus plicatilis]|uniref:Uncharacterized protein n=1 Tax=Brachionus plicatilis TaxID=10195 RepID=A0A3M7RYR7_BRAPC|nr:hypothetical protein BpHYR1_024541 [Brachionus plicatilis]